MGKQIVMQIEYLLTRLWAPVAISTSLLISAQATLADQCMLVPKSQALAAMARLEPGQTIYSWCELCSERKPKPMTVETIELINDSSTKSWEIKINNRTIDLAYTYVRSNDLNARISRSKPDTNSYINLSIIAKCPATGFTPIISIK